MGSVLSRLDTATAAVAQDFINQAVLVFTDAKVTNITNDGFDLALQGSLTNTGPLDATISFVGPVTIAWQGHNIATIQLPDIHVAANQGVPKYVTNGYTTITDQDKFTQFSAFLMHNPSFDWTISTDKLRLIALEMSFDNLTLEKTITMKAWNGLPGIAVSNFKLGDDNAGGIHMEIDVLIPSPSQLGIELGTVGFTVDYNGVPLGPVSGDNLYLAANTQTSLHLSGHASPKTSDDLKALGVMFTDYSKGKTLALSATGVSIQPPGNNSPVKFLSSAFQTLTLDISLPGQPLTIISSITLNDLGIKITESGKALVGTNNAVAVYRNPFQFSLQIIEAVGRLVVAGSGGGFAKLEVAKAVVEGDVSHGNDAKLLIKFQDQPLTSTDDAAFQKFQQATNAQPATYGLVGSVDVIARTPIGDVPISDISFDVFTPIAPHWVS